MKAKFFLAYQIVGRIVVRIILAFVGRLTLSGQENIPTGGSYIAVVNHMSKTDTPLVLLVLPRHRLRVFAADKWQRHPIFGPLLGLSGAIWVRRGEVDRRALQAAFQALDAGDVLGMAPEGTRSRSGGLQKARQGPAYIATRTGVPLLPIGIANSDQFRANLFRLRRTHFQVNIGRPFRLPDLPRAKAQELEACSEIIMAHIANLLPERYHGHYAGSPVLAALRSGQDPWPAACQQVGLEPDRPAHDAPRPTNVES